MDAHAKIFGKRPYVHSSWYGRFRVFEDELRERGYSAREYAYTVVKILKKWAAGKGFATIPINAFTGDWALKKFIKVAGSVYVDISNTDMDDELYWSEKTVAVNYIQENAYDGAVTKLSAIVEGLRPLLSTHWLRRYDGGDRNLVVVDKVLDELCEEHNIQYARSYSDIVGKIRGHISIQ